MSYSHSDKRSTQNLGHLGESMQEQQHFLFFPALPAEIRLIIWEYTWPEARVIEAAIHVDFSGDEATEWTYLRPAGSLAAFLRTDVFWRDLDTELPLETCSPLTLGICRESREHTLRHYKFMKHSIFPQHSFYLNSLRDVLWLSLDIASEWEDLEDLRVFYDVSLNSFKTLLIQDPEWNNKGLPDEYTRWSFSILPGLETILLVEFDYDEDDKLQPCTVEEYQRRAKFYKGGYAQFLASGEYCAASHVLYVDSNGIVY